MFRLAFIAVSALLAAVVSRADTVTILFTNLPATFQNGTYNGYATAAINGIPNQLLICDDYFGETYVPSPGPMVYDYSALSSANPLQYAMWNTSTPPTPASIQKYDAAAVLLYDLSQMHAPSSTVITDYQYALWNLMDPAAPYAGDRSQQEQALQAAALAAAANPAQQTFLSGNVYPDLQIYTPTAPFQGNQEFLAFAPLTTPEPSTGIMVGSVILAVLIFFPLQRRMRRRHFINGAGLRAHIERMQGENPNGM